MSDSNRLLIAAAAIGLIICTLIWGALGVGLLTSSPDRAAANGYIQAERGDRYYESNNAILALTHQACTQASEAADEDSQRGDTNKRDLCAQYLAAAAARKGADYTQAQTIIGVVGLLAVIATLVLNYVATLAATEQSKIARRAFEEADSGVIYIEALTGVSFRESRIHPEKDIPEFAFSMRNIGARTVIAHLARVEFIEITEANPFDDPTQPVSFARPNGLPSIVEPILLHVDAEEQVDAAIGRPLEGDEWRHWGLYILGRVTYSTHLSILREAGFCFRWTPGDDDGHVSRVWSYDRRKEQSKD